MRKKTGVCLDISRFSSSHFDGSFDVLDSQPDDFRCLLQEVESKERCCSDRQKDPVKDAHHDRYPDHGFHPPQLGGPCKSSVDLC